MATTTLSRSQVPQLNRLQLFGIGAAVIGLALLALGFFINPQVFLESYIFGFYFVMAFPLGCLAFLMIQHLTGGAWGIMSRRMLEAGALALPIFFILSVPVVLTVYNFLNLDLFIYQWSDPSVVTPGGENFDPLVAHKAPWLSPAWFAARMVIYFVIWSGLALLLRSWSLQQDRGAKSLAMVDRMRKLSGIGTALFVLSVTFFALDVGLSLDAHWYSTMYGVHYMVNAGLGTLAFIILALTQIRHTAIFEEHVPIKPIHDLGKLLFAFTILWTYVSFGQFVIIWSGDVAEFTPWYARRIDGGWVYVSLLLMALSFFAPFLALLSRGNKRNLNRLAQIALVILFMRVVDMVWVILPEFHEQVTQISWVNLAAPVGLFGVWLAIWAWNMQRASLLPLNDPQMDSLHAGGHH